MENKTKKSLILIYLFLCGNILFSQIASEPALGDGSMADPYQITSLENLYWIAAPNSIVPSPDQETRLNSYYIQNTGIDTYETSTWFSRGLIWGSYTNIINISTPATIDVTAGGLVQYNTDTILNCYRPP